MEFSSIEPFPCQPSIGCSSDPIVEVTKLRPFEAGLKMPQLRSRSFSSPVFSGNSRATTSRDSPLVRRTAQSCPTSFIAASVRDWTCSFSYTALTWVRTVLMLMLKLSAISLYM